MQHEDEGDAGLARRLLGGDVVREPIAATKNDVSAWSRGARRIVIKRWRGDGAEASAAAELRAYRLLDGEALAPPLLAHGPRHLVLGWIPARPLLDTVTPGELRRRPELVERFVAAVARLHDVLAPLAAATTPGPIPGPVGAVHGDLLPHNVLIAADGAVRLIDFESAGGGPLYLDLAAVLCVLPPEEAEAGATRYHAARGTPPDLVALRAVLRAYPALRLERLRAQRWVFRDDDERFARMLAWFEHAVARGAGAG